MIPIAIVLLVLLALMGAPLFAIILGAAALGFYTLGIEMSVLHIDIYQLSNSVVLMALPLFTFAGFLLSESKTADRMLRLSQAAFGWMPGGMAFVSLIACAFFTALTGGSGVTIVALGALLLPALVKGNYPEKFSLGLVTSSGSLGLLLVPSVPLLIYGIIAQQMSQQLDMPSVEIVDLYLAGLVPALLMVVLMYGYCVWATRGTEVPRQSFDFRELVDALWEARWELPLPFVVLGGIFSGFLVVSEAAAVTALTTSVEVTKGAENLTLYAWGSKTAKHYFCKTCGIYMYHQRRSDPAECGINLGCIEGVKTWEHEPVDWTDGVNHPSDRQS